MLHDLQAQFLKGIYDKSLEEFAYPFIQETIDKTPQQQISIYRGSIFGGLKNALAETYPVTKELVGDEFFNVMLGQYIKEYPCKVQDLNDYGEELPDFIHNLKQARSIPYLGDVAQLEWFCNVALNTKIQSNNLHELSLLNAEQQTKLKLKLPQGATLIQSMYPVDKIWEVHQYDTDKEIEVSEALIYLLVWKNEFGIRLIRLTEEQFYFLNKINSQIAFVDVCEAVVCAYPQADVNTLFAYALQQGWLLSYTL